MACISITLCPPQWAVRVDNVTFPFEYIVYANDRTIKKLTDAASHFGTEGQNWTYQWLDGGRVKFAFDTDVHRNAFKCLVWLHQISRTA
jgi:hypothetical protein